MKMYDVEKFVEIIKHIGSRISFITEIWTAPTQTPFLVIIVHFIDSNWNLHCKRLDFNPLPGSHTGEVLAQEYHEILSIYGITDERNHGVITLENASNNNKFIEAYCVKNQIVSLMLCTSAALHKF
jgi:hypothetical protein